jgi:hypothetical protein
MHAARARDELYSGSGGRLTAHTAEPRTRGLSAAAVVATTYGCVVHTRVADIHVNRLKEVEALRRDGIDLAGCESVRVACSPDGDFRGLPPGRGHRRWSRGSC